jgi:hypothetical protein
MSITFSSSAALSWARVAVLASARETVSAGSSSSVCSFSLITFSVRPSVSSAGHSSLGFFVSNKRLLWLNMPANKTHETKTC